MVDPVLGWFKKPKYNNKCVINVLYLVKTTWLTRYTWPPEITYEKVSEFIDYEFRKFSIEIEYGILSNPR